MSQPMHFKDGKQYSGYNINASNFVGVNGSIAGIGGLVPAPQVGDEDKFLKGDGTWAEVQGGGGSGSGHKIYDNGTLEEQREGLNFIDFNIIDDSTNDKTEIKPYEITQEEWNEIVPPVPPEIDVPTTGGHIIYDNGVTQDEQDGLNFIGFDMSNDITYNSNQIKMHEVSSNEWNNEIMPNLPEIKNSTGIIIDERGYEYVIGQYIHSDGTKQPIYQKMLITTMPTILEGRKDINIGTTVDTVIECYALLKHDDFWQKIISTATDDYITSSSGMAKVWVFDDRNITVSNKVAILNSVSSWEGINVYIIIKYTKTTDTPI